VLCTSVFINPFYPNVVSAMPHLKCTLQNPRHNQMSLDIDHIFHNLKPNIFISLNIKKIPMT